MVKKKGVKKRHILFLFFLLFVAALALNNYMRAQALQVQGGWLQVRVVDKGTSQPIADVYVLIDMTWNAGWDYALTTDSNGLATKAVPLGDYMFKLSHPNYQTLTAGPYTINSPSTTVLTFQMDTDSGGGDGYRVTFYLRDPNNSPVTSGQVIYLSNDYPVDQAGRVILYDMYAGSGTFRFQGQYAGGGYPGFVQFDFSKTLTIPSRNIDYSVWVGQELVEVGIPPAPPVDPGDALAAFIAFLIANWMWLLIGGVVLYALPHIASLARTAKGV